MVYAGQYKCNKTADPVERHVVFACPGRAVTSQSVSTAAVSHVRTPRSLAVRIVSPFIAPLGRSLPHCQRALWFGGGVCSQTVVPNRFVAVDL